MRGRRTIGTALAVVGSAGVLAGGGCGLLDDAADEGLERLAQGTWTCTAPSQTTYTYEVGPGTYEASWSDPGAEATTVTTGTWGVDGGRLTIDLGVTPDAPLELVVDGVGDLEPADTPTGVVLEGSAGDMLAGQSDGTEEPEVVITAEGTDRIAFQQGDGDVWTCDRQ